MRLHLEKRCQTRRQTLHRHVGRRRHRDPLAKLSFDPVRGYQLCGFNREEARFLVEYDKELERWRRARTGDPDSRSILGVAKALVEMAIRPGRAANQDEMPAEFVPLAFKLALLASRHYRALRILHVRNEELGEKHEKGVPPLTRLMQLRKEQAKRRVTNEEEALRAHRKATQLPRTSKRY